MLQSIPRGTAENLIPGKGHRGKSNPSGGGGPCGKSFLQVGPKRKVWSLKGGGGDTGESLNQGGNGLRIACVPIHVPVHVPICVRLHAVSVSMLEH